LFQKLPLNVAVLWHVCVAMYVMFVFVLSLCVVLLTIIVLRMNLHADSKPLVTMPAWVSI